METSRWDPLQEMLALREQVDRLLDPVRTRLRQTWSPAADVYEQADAVTVAFDLPGVRPEDIDVRLEDHELTVRGKRHALELENGGQERIERPSGTFERHVTLPVTVVPEGVHATYEDGVLEIRIPKAVAAAPQPIEIRRGNLHSRTEGRDGPLREVAIGESLDDTDLGMIDPEGTTEYDPSAHVRPIKRSGPAASPPHAASAGPGETVEGNRVEGGAGI
jgi:HSP20 family molecular chaperone IbpA